MDTVDEEMWVERVLLRLSLPVYVGDDGAVRAIGGIIRDEVEARLDGSGNKDVDADENGREGVGT